MSHDPLSTNRTKPTNTPKKGLSLGLRLTIPELYQNLINPERFYQSSDEENPNSEASVIQEAWPIEYP